MLDFETDTIAFLQAFEAKTLNGAIVNKNILFAIDSDKSETPFVVEPGYYT
jgi:hypothetical protein